MLVRVAGYQAKRTKHNGSLRIRRGLELAGTSEGQLYQGRDLAVTTDHRSVLGEILTKHVGNRDLKDVFPSYANDPKQFLGLGKF